jgi:predicted outer membrane lipoprotein
MYFAALAGLLSICGVPLAIAFGVVFVIWLIYAGSVRK